MKNKKLNKIFSICFVLILAGCALIGGTLASEAEGIVINEDRSISRETNITLIQEQRTENGFTAYTGNKQLVPVVDAVVADDITGYPVNTNFVDRFVTVKNNTDEPLYVRVLIAMPVAFDDSHVAGGQDPINVVYEGDVIGGTTFGNVNYWSTPELVAEGVMCGNTLSNIYSVEYLGTQDSNGMLAKGNTAAGYAMYGVFVHKDVGNSGNNYTFNGEKISYDINRGLDLKIKAQGIQTTGFDNSEQAFAQMANNPWAVGGSSTSTTEN